jgi:hypothetical protein
MNTTYPNKKKRPTPANSNVPTIGAVDIGGGFWGFSSTAPKSNVSRDASGFAVVNGDAANTALQARKPSNGFILMY